MGLLCTAETGRGICSFRLPSTYCTFCVIGCPDLSATEATSFPVNFLLPHIMVRPDAPPEHKAVVVEREQEYAQVVKRPGQWRYRRVQRPPEERTCNSVTICYEEGRGKKENHVTPPQSRHVSIIAGCSPRTSGNSSVGGSVKRWVRPTQSSSRFILTLRRIILC